jgi:hypothetical protein
LKELWSDRLLKILIANLSKIHFGQEMLNCDTQGLYHDLCDFHILDPNIKEDMEFIKLLLVKQKLEGNLVWELN